MPRVKILVEICGRCGCEVVGDNRIRLHAWQHLVEPEDGHEPVFGTPLDAEILERLFALEVVEEVVEEPWPQPEVPVRDATDAEVGESNRLGRRQLMTHGRRNGFDVAARFNRGPVPDQYDRFKRMADSLVIYGSHPDGRRFYCWWIAKRDGEFEFQNGYGLGLPAGSGQQDVIDYVKGKTSLPRNADGGFNPGGIVR